MQRIDIPSEGDTVQLYMQLVGDDQISGPYDALVAAVDVSSRPLPRLTVMTMFDGTEPQLVRNVTYGSGPRHWLPTPSSNP